MISKLDEYLKKIDSFYLFYSVLCVIMAFGFSFVPIFLKQKGFALHLIILLYALYTLVASITILFVNSFSTRRYLVYGVILQAIMMLAFAFYGKYSYLIYVLLAGLYQIFFWVTINYLFFKGTTANNNATNSSFYQLIPGIIGVVVPPISLLVLNFYGYSWLYIISSILFTLSIFMFYNKIPDEKIDVPSYDGIKKFDGLKAITLIEGAFQYFGPIVLTVYSLNFLKTETEYGLFLSFLGLIGLVISVIIAKKSDESHKRKGYLYILFTLLILSVISLIFLKSQLYLLIFAGVFTGLAYLSFPIRLAISMDAKTMELSFWKTREFFLNVGRVPTLLLTSVLVFYDMFWAVFLFYAMLLVVYMILLRIKLENVN